MDKTSKEIWSDYRNGRKFYFDHIEHSKTESRGVCPECRKIGHIAAIQTLMRDFDTDEIIEDDGLDYWCEYGCNLSSMEFYRPSLDRNALKAEIMASRARIRDNSIEVYNKSENPYLHGFNCLYVHYTPLKLDKGYSVFFDYYLEYAHNGRDESAGKRDMVMQKKRPTSKEAKELLLAWMIERFEKATKGA